MKPDDPDFHPPSPVCPECLSFDVGSETVAGRGAIESFTINVQP